MQALTLLQKFFSVDMVIYAAIVLVAAAALARCTMPLSRVAARLRRAARTIVTESKQNKEKKSWKQHGDDTVIGTHQGHDGIPGSELGVQQRADQAALSLIHI